MEWIMLTKDPEVGELVGTSDLVGVSRGYYVGHNEDEEGKEWS